MTLLRDAHPTAWTADLRDARLRRSFSWAAEGLGLRCMGCALIYWPLLRRSSAIALIVGSVLIVIHQGELVLTGRWHPTLVWKLPLRYLVPFVVATWSALLNSRVR